MGLLDLVFDTLNAFNNITFIASFIVCLLFVISATCAKSIFYRQNLILNLKMLQDSTVNAHIGGMLR
jgi:hypothetical protein